MNDLDSMKSKPLAPDRLFAADHDDESSNACLNFGNPEVGYVGGFKKAADLAVAHIEKTGRDQDYLVYPIVFGYRQYLELRLKGLLRDSTRLLDEPAPPSKLIGQHKLTPLWTQLRALLESISPDEAEDLDCVGKRLVEFDEMDPDSFAFRYASTKRGTPSLPRDLFHIGLARLRNAMDELALILDGADIIIRQDLDNKEEGAFYDAESAAEMTHHEEESCHYEE